MSEPIDSPRSAAEVLELCRKHSEAGTYVVSEAANERLRVRGLSQSDVRNVLASATSCSFTAEGRWTIEGHSLDGQPLSILVAYGDGELTVL